MFTRIDADTEIGQKLAAQLVETASRTNYNEMAREYNSTKQNSFLVFPWDREKSSTIVQQLQARGLVRDGDYTLSFVKDGAVEKAALKRVSTKEASFIQAAKRGPRAKAAPAATEGTPAATEGTPAATEGTPAATETKASGKAGKGK